MLVTFFVGGERPPVMPRWRSLIFKIGVVAGLVIAVLVAEVAYSLWQSRSRDLTDAARNAANLARVLEEQTVRTFQIVDLTLLAALAAMDRIPADHPSRDAEVRKALQALLPQVPFVRNFYMTDAAGTLRHNSDDRQPAPIDLSDRDYFRALRRPDHPPVFIGGPYFSRFNDKSFIGMGRRLTAPDGSFAGVIVAVVEPEYFRSFYLGLDVGSQGAVSMSLRNGVLLARSPHTDTEIGQSFAHQILFREHLSRAEAGVFETSGDRDGITRIMAYRALPDMPLMVAVGLSREDVLASWRAAFYLHTPLMVAFVSFIVILVVLLIRELRRRESLAAELHLSGERLRFALDASETGTWAWDRATNMSSRDDRAVQIYGAASGLLHESRTGFLRRVHPGDRNKITEATERCMQCGGPYDVVFRIYHDDGSLRWVHSRGETVRGPDGKPCGLVGVCQDITTRRQAEEALVQAQRMEMVSRIAGGVAHDFNNLLQVILGNAEILSDRLADAPALRRWADMTKVAAQRGAELTRRLLAFARRQSLEISEVDVNRLIVDMSETMRRNLYTATLETDLEENLWLARVDSIQLENALLNLLLNARDAMPFGGRVVISTSNVELDEKTCALFDAELPAGRYVCIALADSGIGMSSQVLERACEPFFTTKEVGQGSGLGLSMVFGFVKQSGGHLTIVSRPNQGTTVTLYLPWAGEADMALTAKAFQSSDMPRGTETVLVVEDHDLVRNYVCERIVGLGYKVLECADGDSALVQLARDPGIQLLFTDLMMPGMDGLALAQQAQRLRPGLRVLLTSGDAEAISAAKERLDHLVLLPKPYRKTELASRLRLALDKS